MRSPARIKTAHRTLQFRPANLGDVETEEQKLAEPCTQALDKSLQRSILTEKERRSTSRTN
eukprot:gene33617-43448_t